jgi:hypothetical protein
MKEFRRSIRLDDAWFILIAVVPFFVAAASYLDSEAEKTAIVLAHQSQPELASRAVAQADNEKGHKGAQLR